MSPTSEDPEVRVDFVVVTALPEERDAFLDRLTEYHRLPPDHDDIHTYFTANLPVNFPDSSSGTYRIIVMSLLGMGRVEAATAAAAAIQRWRPYYVLLVGIAGGIEASKVRLGDILISDQIVDYELQKLTPQGPEVRWTVQRADARLLAACQNYRSDDWQKLIQINSPAGTRPDLHIGPIASGDKVIAFDKVLAKHQAVWPKLIGVEMEAAGVAAAAFQSSDRPGFFMVRGVSDLADENKNSRDVEKWRAYACAAAASFAMALLNSGPVPLATKQAEHRSDEFRAGINEAVDHPMAKSEHPLPLQSSLRTIRHHRIFVASPSDVEAERQIVRRVVTELNRSLTELGRDVEFELLSWEDMHPDLGNPQMVILDRALLKKCDIFVAILWKRFGRPPGGRRPTDGEPYLSGTQREIDEAIAARRASRSSRPVIMIYRKVDPPPIDMSDEEFRQLTLVRNYLRQFEPDGENPALISKFTADQFETALRKDLLQVLGEFQQVEAAAALAAEPGDGSAANESASTTPATGDRAPVVAQTPGSRRGTTSDDELPPETPELGDDGVAIWLRQMNLGGLPFEQNRAEQERALSRYFVPPPDARIQSLVDAVRPGVIFGSAGCGKTALRTMVQTRCYPQRPEADTLGIVFGRKELNSLITGEKDQLVLPAPIDFGAAFARAVLAQLEVHAPAVLKTHAHAFDWAQNEHPRGSLAAWLETLADVIRQAGFKQTLFLIDQLDEVRVIQAQPERMADVLEPLMALELREAHALAFDYFLPDSIASQLQSRNQIFRLDRCEVLHLRWTEDLLRRLIRQRLVYHSIKQSAPYNSIGELCDSTDGLAETIDAELIGLAAGNPRALLWLAHKLIQLHGQNDDPPPLIRPKTWNDVKTAWWLEGRPLFFPSILFWLRQDRVYFHTREIVLSGLSLALLTCLIRAEGRVCDRLELARAGWPDARPEGVSQRAIDEAVRRLKLDLTKQGVDARWVSTVRGRGFRLAAPDQTSPTTGEEEDNLTDEH